MPLLSGWVMQCTDARDAIVADYVRSARVNVLQVARLRVIGFPDIATDDDLAIGVWSARAETIEATLDLLDREHGGVTGYLREAGISDSTVATLQQRLLVTPTDVATVDRPGSP